MTKFILTLLLLCSTSAYCEESFIGANLGASKVSYDRTSNIFGYNMSYAQQHRYGINVSLSSGSRHPISEHVLLGYVFDFGAERTIRKEHTLLTKIISKRNYITNLIATLSYRDDSPIIPYVLAGVSYTKFIITRETNFDTVKKNIHTMGWCAGGGIDYAISEDTYLGIQFTHTYYGENRKAFNSNASSPLYLYSPESYNLISIGVKFII